MMLAVAPAGSVPCAWAPGLLPDTLAGLPGWDEGACWRFCCALAAAEACHLRLRPLAAWHCVCDAMGQDHAAIADSRTHQRGTDQAATAVQGCGRGSDLSAEAQPGMRGLGMDLASMTTGDSWGRRAAGTAPGAGPSRRCVVSVLRVRNVRASARAAGTVCARAGTRSATLLGGQGPSHAAAVRSSLASRRVSARRTTCRSSGRSAESLQTAKAGHWAACTGLVVAGAEACCRSIWACPREAMHLAAVSATASRPAGCLLAAAAPASSPAAVGAEASPVPAALLLRPAVPCVPAYSRARA